MTSQRKEELRQSRESLKGFASLATASTTTAYHKRADRLARAIRHYEAAADARMVAICRGLYQIANYGDFRAAFTGR